MKCDKKLLVLLDTIKNKKDLFSLLELGLELSQIPLLLKQAEQAMLIVRTEEGISLTESGTNLLNDNINSIKRRGFILPLNAARMEKLPVNAVYLPKRIVQDKQK